MSLEHSPERATGPGTGERSERLGAYRLVEMIGEGGMGEVWLAEQLEPVRRQVAVKLLKLGMDSRAVVARFEAERQMLALMDHPNIARVYDGGLTANGRPYFAMELVRGVTLTEYCDAQNLPTIERLRMFIDVCHAVQHAHLKGIIHRDLKPSNVLVTLALGTPQVKVIDFGIAKAVGGQWLTDKTLHTKIGEMLGTPAYMSPEQAQGFGVDVDTRSDIYSLGVILYELLVGTLPFDPPAGTPLEFAIREYQVAAPSVRLRTLATRDMVARFRHTTTDALRSQLSGDLDWIVLCAVEKDRARRYETANAFARDLERFLAHEPIAARPPSATYRFGKFVRRHRAGTIAAGVAISSLIFAAAAGTIGLARSRAAERAAREQAETAVQVSNFLVDLFAVNDPGESRGASITAREMLDRGATRMRVELRTEPIVRARLLATMSRVYAALGSYTQAEALLREAITITQQLPDSAASLPNLLRNLAGVVEAQGRNAEADTLLKGALRRSGRDAPDSLVAPILFAMAGVEMRAGHHDPADSLLQRVVAVHQKSGDSLALAEALVVLANLHDDDPVHSEPMMRRAYAIDLAMKGPEHPRTLQAANNLALLLWGMGRLREADSILADVVRIRERVLGPTHQKVGQSLLNVGLVRLEAGDAAGAIAPLERTSHLLALTDSGTAAYAMMLLARARLALGNTRDACPALERAIAVLERKMGPSHNWTAQGRTGLGECYLRVGRTREAEAVLARAVADQEHNWGSSHRRMVDPLLLLARLDASTGRGAAADTLYLRALKIVDTRLATDHPTRIRAHAEYAEFARHRTE